jgi:hypothetical protein
VREKFLPYETLCGAMQGAPSSNLNAALQSYVLSATECAGNVLRDRREP